MSTVRDVSTVLEWSLGASGFDVSGFFFFSSRRRHTRWTGDWSSDVCSSDLIARAAGVPLTLDDFETVREGVPVLCDLKPSGRFVTTDLHRAGGVPQVMKTLLAHGVLNGDAATVSGQTVAEVLRDVPDEPRPDQEVIRPWRRPLYPQGHLAVLRGNLASEGAVAKITGIKHLKMTGPARVFDCEEDSLAAILAGRIKPGDVLVIRYEGPKGGP